MFFPVLVILAYMADRNLLCFQRPPQEGDKEALPLGYNPNTIEGIELMQNHKNKDDVAMVQDEFRKLKLKNTQPLRFLIKIHLK